MGAYTKVDTPTRRKMDEMLKTWKEPVAGALGNKPVFPPEVVKPIENALIAAKNVALQVNQSSFQGQQYMLRGARPPAPPHRDTPTPPNVRPATQQPGQQYPPPNGHMPPHGGNPAFPMRPHNVCAPSPWFHVFCCTCILTTLPGARCTPSSRYHPVSIWSSLSPAPGSSSSGYKHREVKRRYPAAHRCREGRVCAGSAGRR